MIIDASGNVLVDNPQPLQDLGEYLNHDYDDVAHKIEDTLSKGDEDDEMAYNFGY